MKTLRSLLICLFLLVLFVNPAWGADVQGPEPPSTIEITKDNDTSASMLSSLLGPSWQSVAGGAAVDSMGGLGRYHGVIVGLLGMFNLLAMAFVATQVIFQWGIFALQTAHEGKKMGGSQYSSLWLPVRQALAFAFVSPILNGLSVLQVLVIAGIAFSINTANAAWDWAGSYIAEHSQSGIIDSAPPMIEEESLSMIQPLFQSAVIHEALKARGGTSHRNPAIQPQDFPSGRVQPNSYQSVEIIDDTFVVVRKPLVGSITIYMMPGEGMSLGDLGGMVINAPVRSLSDGGLKPMDEVEQAMQAIAETRADSVMCVWEWLCGWARYYLDLNLATGTGQEKPAMDGLALARSYREVVSSETSRHVQVIKNAHNSQRLLEKALGSKDGASQLGWVSAGLFSVTLAHAQREIDAVSFGGGAGFLPPNVDTTPADKSTWYGAVGNSVVNFFGPRQPKIEVNKAAWAAIRGSAAYAASDLLGGRVIMTTAEDGDAPSVISKAMAAIFLDGNGGQGLLGETLSKFRNTDPILVVTDFGQKLYTFGSWLAVGIMGGSFGSFLPVVGEGFSAVTGNAVVSAAMILSITAGFTLFVVAPWTVVFRWSLAVLHWLYRVLEILVAGPFWSAMHLAPEGQGFAGLHARRGYIMLIDLVCRPSLMVFGACAAVAFWLIGGVLYVTLFSAFLNALTSTTGSQGGLVIEVMTTTLVMIFFFYLYAKIFSWCINDLPDRVMRLIDSHGGIGGLENDSAAVQAAAGATVAKGTGFAAQAMSTAANSGGQKKDQKPDKPQNTGPAQMSEDTSLNATNTEKQGEEQ